MPTLFGGTMWPPSSAPRGRGIELPAHDAEGVRRGGPQDATSPLVAIDPLAVRFISR